MAYDVDKFTDKELARLEKRIKREYAIASAEVQKKANEYFKKFEERYKAEYKAYKAGKYTDEQFKQWYYAQVGRGEGWKVLQANLAQRMVDANVVCQGYSNNLLPKIYTENNNYIASIVKDYASNEGVTGIKFDLVDEYTVKRLMAGAKEVRPYKKIEINLSRDYHWNKTKLQNALLQGVLQGEGIKDISRRFESVTEMNRTQSIRNARTAVTGAQNAGKQDRFNNLADQGCKITKEWSSTGDSRTREAHAEADGQEVPESEPFEVGGEELMYPGDPDGSAWNIYNCRCSMRVSDVSFKSIR